MSFEELLKVEVFTASKQAKNISDVPASIAVITHQQIKQRGYIHLDDALRDIGGIDFIRIHGAYPTIRAFRGSYGDENKRILFLIDGVDENNINGSFEMGGYAYSLHNVERIEVIWGPGSALYGANAYSGIVNIITKHNNRDFDGFYLSGTRLSFNGHMGKFAYNHTSDNSAFSLSGSLFNSDGPKFENRHPDFSDAYADNVKSLILRYSLKTGKTTTTFGVNLFDTPMGDGTFTMSPTDVLGLPPSGYSNTGNGGFVNYDIDGKPGSRWQPYSNTFFVDHRNKLSDEWRFSSKIYSRKTGVDESSYSFIYIGNNTFRQGRWAHDSSRQGIELQFDYFPNKSSSLVSGLQYVRDDLEKGYRRVIAGEGSLNWNGFDYINLDATYSEADSFKQNNIGLFSQYIQQTELLTSTDFTLGLRYDNNQSYGTSISPHFGIVNKPANNWIVKLNYGEAFRAPTAFERFSSSIVRLPNLDLKPEQIKTAELTLSYQFNSAFVQATLFQNDLSDIITAALIDGGLNQNQNVGSAKINGLQVNLKSDLFERVNFNFNYIYQDGKQTLNQNTFAIANIARHKANATIDYSMYESISLFWGFNWVGTRSVATTNPLGEVDGYLISNLSLRKQDLFLHGLELSLTVNNLFDENSVDPGIRSADGSGIFGTVHEQPGRNYAINLGYRF